jgi:uncharacterized membrane protein
MSRTTEGPSSGKPTSGLETKAEPPTETAETPGQSKEQPISRIEEVIHEAIRLELRSFSGPLPPPEILRAYNEIIPDGAHRILLMAEKEQTHRHAQENRENDGNLTLAKRGQLIGGGLALLAIVGAIYLLATGRSATGLSVLAGVAATFGTAFVYDRIVRSRPSDKPNGKETKPDLPKIPSPDTN